VQAAVLQILAFEKNTSSGINRSFPVESDGIIILGKYLCPLPDTIRQRSLGEDPARSIR
jgi:hypothetical protein